MSFTLHLPLGLVAALITATEYCLSLLAALSARATLHGVWLISLHRGRKAAIDTRTRDRRAFRKDVVCFLLTLALVIAAAGVESNLKPTWILATPPRNSSFCVSMYGKYFPSRVVRHRPPFRVGVEPWIVSVAHMLGCRNGIASIGVGSWTDVDGNKMDMCGPVCVNEALNLSTVFVGAEVRRYTFDKVSFNPFVGVSPAYTLFPLRKGSIGLDTRHVGTVVEGTGECSKRGISAYFMGMNAEYETMRIQSRNMSFAVHETLCKSHSGGVKPIPTNRLQACIRGAMEADVHCIRESATPADTYSVRLSDMAALYISDKIDGASYACVETTVQIEYVFITAQQATNLILRKNSTTTNEQQNLPRFPVLIPTSVRSISGSCERTIAPVAQAALLYSIEQEWWDLEFAPINRQIRFHAYMMAVADSLFPMPTLPEPESSFNEATCFIRPTYEVTLIPWSWATLLLVMLISIVTAAAVSAFIFRALFRGESWLVGSAKWSIARLMGESEGDNKNQVDQEAHIEAVPIPSDFNQDAEPRDWRYEFRIRSRDLPDDGPRVQTFDSLHESNPFHKQQ